MKRYKKFTALLLALLMAAMLAACGNPLEDELYLPFFDTWYEGGDLTGNCLELKSDGTWAFRDGAEEKAFSGLIEEEDEGILDLCDDAGGLMLRVYMEGEALQTVLSAPALGLNTGTFLPTSRSEVPFTPYFEEHGIDTNYTIGDGEAELPLGFSYFITDTGNYTRVPATWRVDLLNYSTSGNGYERYELEAVLHTASDNAPNFIRSTSFSAACNWSLVDYYTGCQLVEPNASNQGKNCYSYRSDKQDVEIEYSYTTQWERLEDKSYTFTLTLYIRKPVGYDGLIFCASDAPSGFDTKVARADIYERATLIPVLDLPDPQLIYSGIRCPIVPVN